MRALRAAVVYVLMLVATGSLPALVICARAEQARHCNGDTCTRCNCKRTIDGAHLRGPCPCCRPPQNARAVTLLPPAVLPPAGPSLRPPPARRLRPMTAATAGSYEPRVPHPPPRASLLF